jgi:outer membrane protein TolC
MLALLVVLAAQQTGVPYAVRGYIDAPRASAESTAAAVVTAHRAPRTIQDTIPIVTLEEALRAATRLDPNYVSAAGQSDNAEWFRRAAWSAFILPSISLQADYSFFSATGFNPATFEPVERLASASITGRYDLFTGGQKVSALRSAQATVDAAEAGVDGARFGVALETEGDYYAVLVNEELSRVAAERVQRSEEQFAVARARVLSGAAVQTDSLQLLLEVKRAQVNRLIQDAETRVSHYQLGRRIGIAGAARAAPLDTIPAPPLPFTLEEAVRQALVHGPVYRAARASERAASAVLTGRRAEYLPRLSVAASIAQYDNRFFPEGSSRNQLALQVTLPIWDGGFREIELSRARVSRDVARAVRDDLERAVWRDVAQAYHAYNTSREVALLAGQALVVARENYRVQQTRYRSGATTILDLITTQVALAEAEGALVQARFGARLARAGLEATIGTRIDFTKDVP